MRKVPWCLLWPCVCSSSCWDQLQLAACHCSSYQRLCEPRLKGKEREQKIRNKQSYSAFRLWLKEQAVQVCSSGSHRQFELVTPGSSPAASIIYNSIKLTLLAPCRPWVVLQWGPFGRGFRPRGDRLDGPRLFSWQSLQTDVSFLEHLLDVLQALQCLQDTGLQAESSPLTLSHRSLRQNVQSVHRTLMSSDRATSYWLWRFLRSVNWFFSADSRKRSMSVSADSAPSCDWHLSTAWEASR